MAPQHRPLQIQIITCPQCAGTRLADKTYDTVNHLGNHRLASHGLPDPVLTREPWCPQEPITRWCPPDHKALAASAYYTNGTTRPA